MATNLDLQEQEQLDTLKAFWQQYGNLITWTLLLALSGYAVWNGWQWWQRDQAIKAGAMYDELDRSAQAADADRAGRIFNDLKERFPRTAQASHGGLLAARIQADKGQAEAARASLGWVADNGSDDALRSVARLRLAALLLDAQQPDEALKQLAAATAPGFDALVADRRGDILMAQGKKAEAREAFETAYRGLTERLDYRRVVEAKLTALGAAPAASGAAQ